MEPKEVNEKITALGIEISIASTGNRDDFISLTDIARFKNDEPSAVIANWMRNRDTIDFLGVWENLYNPDFNSLEFEGIEQQAGKTPSRCRLRSGLRLPTQSGSKPRVVAMVALMLT